MSTRNRWLPALCAAIVTACGGGSSPTAPDAAPTGIAPTPEVPAEGLPTGGAGGDTCRVTSLEEEGPGTLYECVTSQTGARTIVFDVAGSLSLPRNTYVRSDTTIDGTTARAPGITVRMLGDSRRALILEGPVANVVIRGLRFEGDYGEPDAVEYDLLALDGDDGLVSGVLVEQCAFVGATDGALDITGSIRDAIARWNLFYGNPLTMLIRYGTRERISLHRNVFAENGERNPQIRGDVRTIDFVNNVVYDWTLTRDGYGTEIRNEPGGSVDGNFVGNAFLAAHGDDGAGFTIYDYPGGSAGRLFVEDNVCQPPCDVPSTTVDPLPAPLPRSPWRSAELRDRLLPGVGAPYRTARDSAVLDRVRAALPSSPAALPPRQPWSGDRTPWLADFPLRCEVLVGLFRRTARPSSPAWSAPLAAGKMGASPRCDERRAGAPGAR